MQATLKMPKDSRVRPQFPVRRFSLPEYHRLVEIGVLTPSDRVELLNGWIVPKIPQYPPHANIVEWLVYWFNNQIDLTQWRVRSQLPVTLVGDNEPEPDIAIVAVRQKGVAKKSHPKADSIRLIIEVSDTTLLHDQREKLVIYACAKVPEYWIVKLAERQVEVHSDPNGGRRPTYRSRKLYVSRQAIHIPGLSRRSISHDIDELFAEAE